jgi:predicted MFS family arabinose efflux permease
VLSYPINLYKKAYSGLSKESWYLSFVMLINRSGTMVVPFLTIYCTQKLNFSIIEAGLIMAIFGLGSVFGAFFGGKFTDKIGFYYLQIGALLSGGLMFFIISFLETFWSLGIGTFILSMCNESFRPANATAIAYYSTEKTRTRSNSLNRLAVNLGWSFGGALGGFLASVDYHLLFYVDGFSNILAAVFLIKLLPAVKNSKSKETETHEIQVQSPYQDKLYLAFIILTILFSSCFFQLFTLQPVFFKTEWKLTEQFIGGLMAMNGLIIVFTEMLLVNNLEGKRSPLYFTGIGVIIAAFSYAILIFFPAAAWLAVISIILVTLGEMIAMPFMNTFWMSRSNDRNRGEYAALYTIAWSVAQIIGPIYGSFLIEYGGYKLFWYFIFGICLLTASGYFYLNILSRKREVKNVMNIASS